jgi:hypothetical protein
MAEDIFSGLATPAGCLVNLAADLRCPNPPQPPPRAQRQWRFGRSVHPNIRRSSRRGSRRQLPDFSKQRDSIIAMQSTERNAPVLQSAKGAAPGALSVTRMQTPLRDAGSGRTHYYPAFTALQLQLRKAQQQQHSSTAAPARATAAQQRRLERLQHSSAGSGNSNTAATATVQQQQQQYSSNSSNSSTTGTAVQT